MRQKSGTRKPTTEKVVSGFVASTLKPEFWSPVSAARGELPNGEIFYSLREAQILIEKWRRHYNTVCRHSALGYRPPSARKHHSTGPGSGHALEHQPSRLNRFGIPNRLEF